MRPFSGNKTEVTATNNDAPRRTANGIDGDPADTLRIRLRTRRQSTTSHEISSASRSIEPEAAFSASKGPAALRKSRSVDDRRPSFDDVKAAGRRLPPIAGPTKTSLNRDSPAEVDNQKPRRPLPTFADTYRPLREIGKGSYGVVYAVEERNVTSGKRRVFACKVLKVNSRNCDIIKQTVRLKDAILREVELMMSISRHPNLQDLVDFAVTDDRIFIISSMCYGGDLRMALDKYGLFCEEQARSAMAGIFRGLSHLHSQGIVHRDIKLDNILVAEKGNLGSVKIIDMGFAKKLCLQNGTGSEALHTVCGTPIYIAPELVALSRDAAGAIDETWKTGYGTKVDMWSCGVVMFTLLSGYPPFYPKNTKSIHDLFADIRKGRFAFDGEVWQDVSESAKDLIVGLLNVDPDKRLSAEQALSHPWFLDCSASFFNTSSPHSSIRSKIAGTGRKNLRVRID